MYRCAIGAILIHFLAYICNLFYVRFINNEENIKFYMKLEYIDRSMKIDKVDALYAMLRKINKYNVVLLIVIMVSLIGLGFLDRSVGVAVTALAVSSSEVTFVLELSNCSNIIVYFSLRLRFINAIIANHLKASKNKKRSIRRIAAKTHDFNTSETDVYLRELIDGFSDFQRFCRFQMFLFCSKCVIGAIIYFQISLIGIRIKMAGYLEYFSVVSFVTYSSTVILVICFCCEMFFNDAMETRQLLITVMSTYTDGPLRDKAARMLKTLKSCPLRISVYDMWDMDARLVLNMFFVTTMVMVTQLQFAIL